MSGNRRKPAVALAATAAIALFASACTGQSNSGASDDASKETTINFWHGWSAPNEVKEFRPRSTPSRRRTPTST